LQHWTLHTIPYSRCGTLAGVGIHAARPPRCVDERLHLTSDMVLQILSTATEPCVAAQVPAGALGGAPHSLQAGAAARVVAPAVRLQQPAAAGADSRAARSGAGGGPLGGAVLRGAAARARLAVCRHSGAVRRRCRMSRRRRAHAPDNLLLFSTSSLSFWNVVAAGSSRSSM